MLKRETKDLQQLIIDKLLGRETEGSIDFSRTWKLAKLAFKNVFNG
ncbi:MAG: hypothetical protein ACKN97_04645 [Acidobacteriota bacterium]